MLIPFCLNLQSDHCIQNYLNYRIISRQPTNQPQPTLTGLTAWRNHWFTVAKSYPQKQELKQNRQSCQKYACKPTCILDILFCVSSEIQLFQAEKVFKLFYFSYCDWCLSLANWVLLFEFSCAMFCALWLSQRKVKKLSNMDNQTCTGCLAVHLFFTNIIRNKSVVSKADNEVLLHYSYLEAYLLEYLVFF